MAIVFVNDSDTISTTEYSLPAKGAGPTAQTDDCILQPFIDFGNMIAGDQYQVRLYEKYDGGGTQRLVDEWILTGVQSKPMLAIPTVIVGEGWDVTVKRLAGSDRIIYWSLRKVT